MENRGEDPGFWTQENQPVILESTLAKWVTQKLVTWPLWASISSFPQWDEIKPLPRAVAAGLSDILVP